MGTPDESERGRSEETGQRRRANLAAGGESLNVLEGAVDLFFGVVVVG